MIIEKEILNVLGPRDTGVFDLTIDSRSVYVKPREQASVFISMKSLNAAIVRARHVRRPGQFVYGGIDPQQAAQDVFQWMRETPPN